MPHSSFDPIFQRHIVASFLESDLLDGLDCLDPDFYEDEITGHVAGLIREFAEKHKQSPTQEALIHELKTQGPAAGRKLTEYYELIEDIYEKVGHNGGYYRGKALEFIRHRQLASALREAYRECEQGDVEGALGLLQRKLAVTDKADGGVDYFSSLGERAKRYDDIDKGKDLEGRISTGFSSLDVRMGGGLGKGETGVLLAPAKHGKTTALVSFAANAVTAKKKALYVTLELSEKLIASKFDTFFYGEGLDTIKKGAKVFMAGMVKKKKELEGGKLTIAWYPTKMFSIFQLERLIQKTAPDIVFVDYAAILRPAREADDRRFQISSLHEGLRATAGVCQVPIWTAHQANRQAFSRKTIEMDNISEDIQVAGIADVIVSINQKEEDRRSGKVNLYIAGNRLGESQDNIECTVNWKLSRITQVAGGEDLGK